MRYGECPYCRTPYRKQEGRYCVSCGAHVRVRETTIVVEQDVEEFRVDGVVISTVKGPPRLVERRFADA